MQARGSAHICTHSGHSGESFIRRASNSYPISRCSQFLCSILMSNIIPKISTHADLICAENLIAVCDEQTTNDDYCRVMNHEQRHVQMQRRSSAEPSKEFPDGPPDGFACTVRDPAIDRGSDSWSCRKCRIQPLQRRGGQYPAARAIMETLNGSQGTATPTT